MQLLKRPTSNCSPEMLWSLVT